jgi:hypothetical protein
MKRLPYRFFIVALFAACPGSGWSQSHARTPEEYDKRDRQIEIHAQQLSKGIRTGLVIAYGHRIAPPYQIENKNGRMYVNGVQVRPSLISEREFKAHPLPEMSDSAKAMNESLWKTETELKNMARRGIAPDDILKFAKNQPYVNGAKLGGTRELILNEEDSVLPLHVILPLPGDTLPSDTEKNARANSAQHSELLNIQSHLKKGECVIFVDGGISGHPLTRTFPAVIRETMENPALSTNEKFQRLHKVLRFEPAVRDILANFTPEEWNEGK